MQADVGVRSESELLRVSYLVILLTESSGTWCFRGYPRENGEHRFVSWPTGPVCLTAYGGQKMAENK